MVEVNLPDFKEIKKLEKISQKKGSGIVYEELLGKWNLKYVWKKGSGEVDNISSSFLQVLSAELELRQKIPEEQMNFEITNSITFGILNLIFIGNAKLKGDRPLLPFYFEKLQVKLTNFLILNKSLKKPEDKKMPFFSLIGISTKDKWICARGRGGGLAIWIKS